MQVNKVNGWCDKVMKKLTKTKCMYKKLLEPIHTFLSSSTPDEWVEAAVKPESLPILLADHLLCELKAAQSALFLIRKYAVDGDSAQVLNEWIKPYEQFAYKRIGSLEALRGQSNISKHIVAKDDSPYSQDLIDKMVLLIKEELHHFYQVLEIIESRGLKYHPVEASRYAKGLRKHVRTYEPAALVDKLIIGAYIEARSCERFAKLAPHLDDELSRFYVSLLRSEARHYQDYLKLAEQIAGEGIEQRVAFFAEVESELITSPDRDFKFHSGAPA